MVAHPFFSTRVLDPYVFFGGSEHPKETKSFAEFAEGSGCSGMQDTDDVHAGREQERAQKCMDRAANKARAGIARNRWTKWWWQSACNKYYGCLVQEYTKTTNPCP